MGSYAGFWSLQSGSISLLHPLFRFGSCTLGCTPKVGHSVSLPPLSLVLNLRVICATPISSSSFATFWPRDEIGIDTSCSGPLSVSSPPPLGQTTQDTITMVDTDIEPLQMVFWFRSFSRILGCPDGANHVLQTFGIRPSITFHGSLPWRYLHDIVLGHQGTCLLQILLQSPFPFCQFQLLSKRENDQSAFSLSFQYFELRKVSHEAADNVHLISYTALSRH